MKPLNVNEESQIRRVLQQVEPFRISHFDKDEQIIRPIRACV